MTMRSDGLVRVVNSGVVLKNASGDADHASSIS